jgi:hypothetical protein
LAEERRLRRLKHRPANLLHVRPNLDYYHEQARRLHKSHREKDPASKLHAAQFAVARGVGFASWPMLAAAIHARERAANELHEALLRRNHEAIVRIVREQPLALLDAGSVAFPEELGLLLKLVPMRRHDPDMLTALLDAVAEHHKPEGLEECVGVLLNWGADPFYANDTIEDRRERAEASPNGAQAAELFQNALGVLAWYVDEPEHEYMPQDD